MGMAASQARYLALTARKTNTEYEGQQINQARTALANQSANLFNRLLNLKVPDPPKTSDYTTIQYSYSDGENDSVIDDWKQLSGVNPDYNYLVRSHYIASMYTGALKQLTDPQVQVDGNGARLDNWNTIALGKSLLDTADETQKAAYDTLQQTKATQEIEILNIQTQAYINNSENALIDSTINQYLPTPYAGYTEYTMTSTTGATYHINHYSNPDAAQGEINNIQSLLTGINDMITTNIMDVDTLNYYLRNTTTVIDNNNISKIADFTNTPPYSPEQKDILSVFGLQTDGTVSRIVKMEDVQQIINDDSDHDYITDSPHELKGTFIADTNGDPNKNLSYFANEIRTGPQALITAAENDFNQKYNIYNNLLNNYNNNITKPTYIGNSELTPILNPTDEQRTELLQVVKDMKADNIDTDILNCFDDAGNYLGGIYSFKMNGTTYYTTQKSLEDAYRSYPRNGSNNIIDAQYKMPYYNASYVDKRIEKESYALLETDGNGRFKTVKFDNDSIVYNLNTETVTDEVAYQDAMSKYTYQKEKYEKTIADINAKTSIIQKEDRTLELRLKQLDTEQNALKTEMDAVKKVIKDNVEHTFKTFSD